MADRPRRAIEITLKLGADDWNAVRGAINHLAYQVAADGTLGNQVSGGYSSGWTLDVSEAPITHDEWEAALNAYLAELDARKQA